MPNETRNEADRAEVSDKIKRKTQEAVQVALEKATLAARKNKKSRIEKNNQQIIDLAKRYPDSEKARRLARLAQERTEKLRDEKNFVEDQDLDNMEKASENALKGLEITPEINK